MGPRPARRTREREAPAGRGCPVGGRVELEVAREHALGGGLSWSRPEPGREPSRRKSRICVRNPWRGLAQLDAPLVEELMPHEALHGGAVLVQARIWPALYGVSRCSSRQLLGRLPGKVRCGTSDRGTPLAASCSAV